MSTAMVAGKAPLRSTAIGDLPDSWETAQIGDLFAVQQGKALSQAARSGPSKTRFLRTANVFWGRVDTSNVDRMQFSVEEAARLSLRQGDLLVCEGGDIGRSAIWTSTEPGYSFQNHLHRLRPLVPTVDPLFVMYWLQAAFVHLGVYVGVGNRTTIPNLSASRLKQLEVPQPPLPEQRAIAAVLSKLQERVELQDRIVATLRELKTATMAKLFREGLRGEPLKQTEIGEIPESWTIVSLGDHCRIGSGGTPSRDHPEYWGGHIPWVRTGEINYRPIRHTEEFITEKGLENSAARLFAAGTLLMAMYGQGVTRGRVAFLAIEATTNQACAALLPSASLDASFLYAYLFLAYDRIRDLGHGANQQNLSADLIRTIRLPLPPDVEEQRMIGATVRPIATRLAGAETTADSWRSLFTATLSALVTGRNRIRSLGTIP